MAPRPRFCEVSDNSSHHYVIPVDKLSEWEEFCSYDESDERGWDTPTWARLIDGGTLTFQNWRIE